MNKTFRKHFPAHSRGFSLVELMVALTIGLLLSGGVAYIMINASKSRAELDRSSRQLENGRYAMQILQEDIRQAGFYGRLGELPAPPAGLPNPCSTDVTVLKAAIALPVVGYDGSDTVTPSCITDRLAGTDILVIKRAGTTEIAKASALANTLYIQASSTSSIIDSGSNASVFTLLKKDGATPIELRPYIVHIYWISSCNVPASGANCNGSTDDGGKSIPTLKMLELSSGSGGFSFSSYAIAEGIENLQLDYGFDTTGPDVNGDGTADKDGSPDSYSTCSTASPCSLSSWPDVTAIRINLLARNPETSQGFTDNKTYTLGLSASVGPFSDAYKRHVYQGLARINNVAGRREL